MSASLSFQPAYNKTFSFDGSHGKCVHKLIEFGANIHIQANDGLTAVHIN